jgi:hypothetical protein
VIFLKKTLVEKCWDVFWREEEEVVGLLCGDSVGGKIFVFEKLV